jgi:hypothetical protein
MLAAGVGVESLAHGSPVQASHCEGYGSVDEHRHSVAEEHDLATGQPSCDVIGSVATGTLEDRTSRAWLRMSSGSKGSSIQ